MESHSVDYSISLENLGMAYHKAKVDYYYSGNIDLLQLLEYEENLHANLENLFAKLKQNDEKWFLSESFLGNWDLVPKSLEFDDHGFQDLPMFSNPDEYWVSVCSQLKKCRKKPKAIFRLMARPSIDFLIFSTLWIIKVGHKYDEKLGDSAYGNRLRRKADGKINLLSMGTFTPYLYPYKKWKEDGNRAIEKALEEKKSIISITADISSFYHELTPDFLLNHGFLKKIGLELHDDELKLTELFVKILKEWATNTPLNKGLPVGLPASAIIANLALFELDQLIEEEIVPLHYGRYVDDIILVIENPKKWRSVEDVWDWIIQRSRELLRLIDDRHENKKKIISYEPSYLKACSIHFKNEKNKIFMLEGDSGKALMKSIMSEMRERSSEWRALPVLPENPEDIPTLLLSVTSSGEEKVDCLQNVTTPTMRRAGFALKLRIFETYARDLEPKTWEIHRKTFLRAFANHALVLPAFFDLAQYLPRVIQLATCHEDFEELNLLLKRLADLMDLVENNCSREIKAYAGRTFDILTKWQAPLCQQVFNAVRAAFPVKLSNEGKKLWKKLENENKNDIFAFDTVKILQQDARRLYSHDLAHYPFKTFGRFNDGLQRQIPIGSKRNLAFLEYYSKLLDPAISEALAEIAKQMKCSRPNSVPYGLAFPTRPFNLTDLYLLFDNPFSAVGLEKIGKAILALRGFTVTGKLPEIETSASTEKQNFFRIKLNKKIDSIKIAVTNWETHTNSWNASVNQEIDPDTTRYRRIITLLNELLCCRIQPDYVIFPEFALPPHWFSWFAYKLHKAARISLVGGVEYQHSHKTSNEVANQIWCALSHEGLEWPASIIYRQDKQRPAPGEEKSLKTLSGKQLAPKLPWVTPPVICHGDFHFSLLVCSELTNIAYRAAIRGKVDALFVLAWNKDVTSFNALVESAALDIHAYIIQCNDRKFGDSRIRAPYKNRWQRDILRIKGGKNDFFAVGEIDISALRQFHSHYRSPSGPFKPVPDGFTILEEREVLPKGKVDE